MQFVLRPKKYLLAALYVSMGGFLNGYDTGSVAAITDMASFEASIGKLSPTMRGWTISSLLLAGVLPSLFAGVLADVYGHLRIVLVGALCLTAGAALEAAAVNLAMVLVGRLAVGLGQGLYLGNLNVYLTEIAPSARRGSIVALPQAMVTLGLCAGYFTCYGSTTNLSGGAQWRLPFAVQAGCGAFLAVACALLPESPRWLLTKGRADQAKASMRRLDLAPDEMGEDEARVVTGLAVPVAPTLAAPAWTAVPVDAVDPAGTPPSRPSWRGVLDIFSTGNRFPTMLGVFILGMVQFSGIDGVLYYAPTLFAEAGLPASTASFVASGALGIFLFAASFLAFLVADHFGRRTLISVGGVVQASCMAIMGAIFAGQTESGGPGGWVIVVLVFVFSLAYQATWGIIGKIYASEIQPAKTRATATALAQGVQFFTTWLVAFITPIFLATSTSGPFFLFAGLSAATLAVLWLYMPETRGKSLESIQVAFDPPVKDLIRRYWSGQGLRRRRPARQPGQEAHAGIAQPAAAMELQ